MITADALLSIEKDGLQEASGRLNKEDLPQLVEWLSEKDDNLRYQTLLLLQYRSQSSDDVYPFWDLFREKLTNSNSYQRSIGLMLIAENVRWDKDRKIDTTLEDYLLLLNDEKPITVRQCIQALSKIIPHTPQLEGKIAEKLMDIDLIKVKETMRRSILLDILNVLMLIKKNETNGAIENYIMSALTGEILDKKAKKQIEAML